MTIMIGARPFRDFDPLMLSCSADNHVARFVYLLVTSGVGCDPAAVTAGVGIVLSAASSGMTERQRVSDAVGCSPSQLTAGADTLIEAGYVAEDGEQLRTNTDVAAHPLPAAAVRYISVGVQILAANAAVNRWEDPSLVHVGSALIATTAPIGRRGRVAAPTWRIAGMCGLDTALASQKLTELTRRHASAGRSVHLPIVADFLR